MHEHPFCKSQQATHLFSAANSSIQFCLPFLLGKCVYGSFSRFRVAVEWLEKTRKPESIKLWLDGSSLSSNYQEKQAFSALSWKEELQRPISLSLMDVQTQNKTMQLTEHYGRFASDENRLRLALQVSVERTNWNRIRGLDIAVSGIFDPGPVVLDMLFAWNRNTAIQTYKLNYNAMEIANAANFNMPQILQTKDLIV